MFGWFLLGREGLGWGLVAKTRSGLCRILFFLSVEGISHHGSTIALKGGPGRPVLSHAGCVFPHKACEAQSRRVICPTSSAITRIEPDRANTCVRYKNEQKRDFKLTSSLLDFRSSG